jgi:predicted pyridoxine 5'-phosphate oxidase superfamily flavin-nucleotide-binding protein
MKLPARSVVWLLPFFLTACFHKTHQNQVQPLAPPVASAPTPKPEPTPAELPPAVATIPAEPTATETNIPAKPKETPKPPVKHRKPVNKNPQQASNGNPGVSAIGQLSSGDPADFRRQTEDSIASTERGMRGINRPLNDQEQKTAAHIREFLKQAKAALASGDVDGAHTLAAKAKVLLGELRR